MTKRGSISTAAALAAILFSPASAAALCFAPSVPPSFFKPSPPRCQHDGCDQREADNYRRQLERYISELQDYAHEAQAYAECEADDAVNDWNNFARTTRVRQ